MDRWCLDDSTMAGGRTKDEDGGNARLVVAAGVGLATMMAMEGYTMMMVMPS